MRVCDISKSDTVKTRYLVIEVPLEGGVDQYVREDDRVVHDLEVGANAAAAIEAKDWKALNSMTPYAERPVSVNRSDAAKRAAQTRAARKAEKAAAAATSAPAGPAADTGASAPTAPTGAAHGAVDG